MRYFHKNPPAALLLPAHLLQTFRILGEYKGKQHLYQEQSPQTLNRLREVAIIQSTESSNRIEGIIAPHARIEQLLKGKTAPQNRSEQEIVAYRNVLDSIHTNHPYIAINSSTLLQFHRDLYQFQPGYGGKWKVNNNAIEETRADGSKFVRWNPTPAHLTDIAMQDLHADYMRFRENANIDPLILIASYVLDFLCIHPFSDGNGRIARLVTLLLLYKEGYEVGKYISLEQIIEQTKDSYYDTLYRSSQGWHEAQHDLMPWMEYFVGVVLLSAYQEFESRVGIITRTRGSKTESVQSAIKRLPVRFKISDLQRACPGVSLPTIRLTLDRLRKDKFIKCIKVGKDAIWEKSKSWLTE
ncbi:MAG: Fic family protein [Candidatus Obscuribacterales bacterium]|nr:Fic family protein [Candidatus Obscuribacterales bacterium]